jgi:hypothetical protein
MIQFTKSPIEHPFSNVAQPAIASSEADQLFPDFAPDVPHRAATGTRRRTLAFVSNKGSSLYSVGKKQAPAETRRRGEYCFNGRSQKHITAA